MGRRHEQEPSTRQGMRAMLLLWAVISAIIFAAAALLALWHASTTTAGGPEYKPNGGARMLETAPQPALSAYLEEKQAALERYEWVDKTAGVAIIPLSMAMESMVTPEDAQSAAGNSEIPLDAGTENIVPAPPPSPAEFQQNLGARLPLDLRFADQHGRTQTLNSLFGSAPVILVLGYYRCPALCSTVMTSVLQSVQGLDLPYSIVAVSIDPRETPEAAARQYAFYRPDETEAASAQPPPATGNPRASAVERLHLLTGQAEAISRLARHAGFGWEYDEGSDQYSHPAGFLVLTPQGVISRYFPGVNFDRRDLRLALIEASQARVGSLAERVILMCSHYDPLEGRYTLAVMTLMRGMALVMLLVLALVFWRLRRRRGRS